VEKIIDDAFTFAEKRYRSNKEERNGRNGCTYNTRPEIGKSSTQKARFSLVVHIVYQLDSIASQNMCLWKNTIDYLP